MQNICTDGKGEKKPMKNDTMSVKDVIVMDTAASLNILAILLGTGSVKSVRLQAASITNVSSTPIPEYGEEISCIMTSKVEKIISNFRLCLKKKKPFLIPVCRTTIRVARV